MVTVCSPTLEAPDMEPLRLQVFVFNLTINEKSTF